MEVRPGYISTEVGLIPEGWAVKPISQVAPLQRGFDLPTRDIKPGPFPIVYSNGVDGSHKTAMVNGPGVVTGRSGTLGKVHYVEADFWPHNTSLWVARFNQNDPRFIYYLYESLHFERFASGSGVPTLNRNDAHSYRIALPTERAEQRAIAATLSDVDALLAGLDQLIAKKRYLKQAAMQQLLTGQTRLPGFSGDWEGSTVGREFEVALGKMLDTEKNVGIPKPYVGNKSIQWRKIDIADLQLMRLTRADMDRYRLVKGDLLVCEGGEVGRAAIWDAPIDECYYQKALHRLRPLRGMNSQFMVATLELWTGCGILDNFVTQTSIAHLPKERFIEVPILVPSTAEQSAIATALSDMDAELAALEARRDKTRALKQAMMQELLTGRTRLV